MRPQTRRESRAVIGTVALISAVAIVVSSCSAGSHSHAAPDPKGTSGSSSGIAQPSATGPDADPSTALAPSEFAHPAAWSATITLSRGGLAGFGGSRDPERGAPSTDVALAREQVRTGLVAVVGDVIVVPTFSSDGTQPNSPASLTLRFLSIGTGKPVASHPLPDAEGFYGMRSLTVGGKPEVEVRYEPKPSATATVPPAPLISAVFDVTGKQVWTSAGQRIATGAAGPDPGLTGDDASGLVRDGGFLERRNSSDPGDQSQRRATISVLDLSGRSLLTIPVFAAFDQSNPTKTVRNGLRVVGGYAVVSAVDPAAATPAKGPGVPVTPVRFTVYDLEHGAKKIADVTEPALPPGSTPDLGWGQVLATCGGKLLLAWPTISQSFGNSGSTTNLTVLDPATGHTTPPISLPSHQPGTVTMLLQAVTDPGCSAVQLNGSVTVARGLALGVAWADGRELWRQVDTTPAYQQTDTFSVASPLTIHNGTVYGLQASSPSSAPKPVAVGQNDGKTKSTGFSLIPVAFTSDGSPIFLQIDGATSATATASGPTTASPTATGRTSPPAALTPPDLYPVMLWVGSPAS